MKFYYTITILKKARTEHGWNTFCIILFLQKANEREDLWYKSWRKKASEFSWARSNSLKSRNKSRGNNGTFLACECNLHARKCKFSQDVYDIDGET